MYVDSAAWHQVLGCIGAGACSNVGEVARIMRFVLRALGDASADRPRLLADAFAQTPLPQRAAFAQVKPLPHTASKPHHWCGTHVHACEEHVAIHRTVLWRLERAMHSFILMTGMSTAVHILSAMVRQGTICQSWILACVEPIRNATTQVLLEGYLWPADLAREPFVSAVLQCFTAAGCDSAREAAAVLLARLTPSHKHLANLEVRMSPT